MTIINSRTDLVTWIRDCRSDVDDLGLTERLADAIQSDDHPAWGDDWSEYLDTRVTRLSNEIAGVYDSPIPDWNFEEYWNVVLGANRTNEDVLVESDLDGSDRDALEAWLIDAEREAWIAGGYDVDELPESWRAHRERAIGQLHVCDAVEPDVAPCPHILYVLAGEGEHGTRETYEGPITVEAIEARLERERAGGDRWAKLQIAWYGEYEQIEDVSVDRAVRACFDAKGGAHHGS